MAPPFTVLHVCMGNICRSPMAERLLPVAVGLAAGVDPDRAAELVHSHSVGTGGWHVGEAMHPGSAQQVRARGGDPTGFRARQLRPAHLDQADLVLTATVDQWRQVVAARPEVAGRTFVLGELARLLPLAAAAGEPDHAGAAGSGPTTPAAVHARGVTLVAAADAARNGPRARRADDLDDPYGRGRAAFSRVADEIEQALRPLAAALFPPR